MCSWGELGTVGVVIPGICVPPEPPGLCDNKRARPGDCPRAPPGCVMGHQTPHPLWVPQQPSHYRSFTADPHWGRSVLRNGEQLFRKESLGVPDP